MAEITATMVKDLRDKTGAGMMDCKKALAEVAGDMEQAIDWLRKKGLSKAAKKSGRTAAEGLVALASTADDKTAMVVEINAETDFVARNEQFQNFVRDTAQLAISGNTTDIDALANAQMNGKAVSEVLTELIANIGENMALRRLSRLSVSNGVVATYMHNAVLPNMGKIGVLVALESTAAADGLKDLGRKIAMHIAATNPEALDVSSVDQEKLARERDVLADQARASGKPEDVIAKMVEGRIRKYYEEVVLMEQVFVMDGETKISALLEKAGKDLGAPVKMTGFVRYSLGEGIEKEETDFAAEVAKAVNG